MLEDLRKKRAEKKFASVSELLLYRCLETPNDPAFSYPDAAEVWHKITWKDVDARVRALAAGIRNLGIGVEDRVAILSSTRIEWILADLAILAAGGATTTIYPSNTPEECEYILTDSGTRLVIAEDDKQVAKLVKVRAQLPDVFRVIVINGTASADGWVTTFAALEAEGKAIDAADPSAYAARIGLIKREHLATLIYTSGTTGQPKGVELLQDCWIFIAEAMDTIDIFKPDDMQFLWLPMSHSFGKVLEVILISANVHTAVDGRVDKIVDNCARVQPTWMAAAPRIFEKAYNKIVTTAEAGGGLKWKIFQWAIGVGKQVSALRQQGQEPSGLLAIQAKVADKLVFSKIRARFGGRIRFFISGSAPLSRDMAEFFHACGMLILEGYGLTESSAASFVNLPDSFAFGTVGPPVPGITIKIEPADGEILIRGRGIMRGYWNKADQTAETLDNGWLRTGDIGELDGKGRLKITDRKKDLIKTSGGKYVAPQALESRLKALCPYISQVLVHGNARNFCIALVTMDGATLAEWAVQHKLLDAAPPVGQLMSDADYARLSKEPAVRKLVEDAVKTINGELPSYSTLKNFALLEKDFSIEDGELTPSLKVKRKVVEKKNATIIEAFYEGQLKSV